MTRDDYLSKPIRYFELEWATSRYGRASYRGNMAVDERLEPIPNVVLSKIWGAALIAGYRQALQLLTHDKWYELHPKEIRDITARSDDDLFNIEEVILEPTVEGENLRYIDDGPTGGTFGKRDEYKIVNAATGELIGVLKVWHPADRLEHIRLTYGIRRNDLQQGFNYVQYAERVFSGELHGSSFNPRSRELGINTEWDLVLALEELTIREQHGLRQLRPRGRVAVDESYEGCSNWETWSTIHWARHGEYEDKLWWQQTAETYRDDPHKLLSQLKRMMPDVIANPDLLPHNYLRVNWAEVVAAALEDLEGNEE